MIKYGPVYIPCHTSDSEDWLSRYLDPEDVFQIDWQTRNHSLSHLGVQDPPPIPRIRVGVLHWPVCASSFAHMHLLATDDQIGEIRQVQDGRGYTLELTDGISGHVIRPTMYLLPPRPLASIPGYSQFWLLTLVDDRYYWWQQSTTIEANNSTTWSAYFNSLADSLGISIGMPSISSAYKTPSNRFTAYSQPIPVLIDAAARAVGLRFVSKIDGSYWLETPEDADNGDSSNDFPESYLAGRGQRKPTADPTNGQPNGSVNDQVPRVIIPDSVQVLFGRKRCGVYSTEPYRINVYLNPDTDEIGAFANNLEKPTTLRNYNATGSGSYPIVGDLTALFNSSASSVPSNYNELVLYAKQTAKDWYSWQCFYQDINHAGIINYPLHGCDEVAQWTYKKIMVSTRVTRARWNDRSLGKFRVSSEPGLLSAQLSPKDFVDSVDCDGSYGDVRTSVTLPVDVYCDKSTVETGKTVVEYRKFLTPKGFEPTDDTFTVSNAVCGDSPPNVTCEGCGWLLEILNSACFELEVEAVAGKCECVEFGQKFNMFRKAPTAPETVDKWYGGTFETCCGCSVAEFFPFRDETKPEVFGKLRLVKRNKECDDGATSYTQVEYKLYFDKCCEAKVIVFSGANTSAANQDNCNDPAEPCGNYFIAKITCIDCPAPTCCCLGCKVSDCGTAPASPPAYYLDLSGFSGGDAELLNIPWVITNKFTKDCTPNSSADAGTNDSCIWEAKCCVQFVEIEYKWTGTKWRLDLTTTSGTARYESAEQVTCCAEIELDRTSSTYVGSPLTVTLQPLGTSGCNCDGAEFLNPTDNPTINVTVSGASGYPLSFMTGSHTFTYSSPIPGGLVPGWWKEFDAEPAKVPCGAIVPPGETLKVIGFIRCLDNPAADPNNCFGYGFFWGYSHPFPVPCPVQPAFRVDACSCDPFLMQFVFNQTGVDACCTFIGTVTVTI